MINESTFNTDLGQEGIVAEFLDKSFYTIPLIKEFKRIEGSNVLQQKGQDVEFSIPKLNLNKLIVDEKAQLDYVNHPLDTFILELSSYIKGQLSTGWYINPHKITEYYFLIWINKATSNRLKRWDDISHLNFCLVSRKKISNYLENQFGLSYEKLNEISHAIRDGQGAQYLIKPPLGWQYKFYYSTQKNESPVNIVLRKQIYLNLCDLSGDVYYKDKIFNVKIPKLNINEYINIEKKENYICPRCNKELVKRNGPYGPFFGCSNFPNCKYTLSIFNK